MSTPLSSDRLWKVRPIISAILDACGANYRHHREQAIDEAMVGFKGRSCIKQYLPKKPIKRGFKIFGCGPTATMGMWHSLNATLGKREQHPKWVLEGLW